MAVTNITDDAVDGLRVFQFFDPDAEFNFGNSTTVSLVSDDGYELRLKGHDFAFDSHDAPTDGTITSVQLYDASGDLVGTIGNVSASLETYYDQVAVHNDPADFTADLLSGADTLTGHGADDYLEGYAGKDSLDGGAGDDSLFGGADADRLVGGAGDDDLDGGTGDDYELGAAGKDLMYGYTGNDTLGGGDDADRLYGEAGNDSLVGGAGTDSLYGGDDNDVLSGGDQNDSLEGGAGVDKLYGGANDDFLGGGDGADRLEGQSGRDALVGDAGSDTLVGGTGNDTMTGGAGNDVFLFNSPADRGDRITDFHHNEDHLTFVAAGFANLDDNFALSVGAHPSATTGTETFLFYTGSHNLYYDADGNGAGSAVFVTTLDHISSLSKSDFSIV